MKKIMMAAILYFLVSELGYNKHNPVIAWY